MALIDMGTSGKARRRSARRRAPKNEFSQFCEETFFGHFLWYNVSRNSEQKEYHEKLPTTNEQK